VALSGTLDTFALPDVLRLLGSTQKTGRLRITGDRGSGSVWVDDGQVVATELKAINALDPTDIEVVFGLLRFEEGSFTFESDAGSHEPGSPTAMDPILGAAEEMLTEWRLIEEVVPSLSAWVGLCPELTGSDVMIDAARWQAIAAIGAGAQVGAIAEVLQLNEIESCRTMKELIELGLVELIEEPAEMHGVADAAIADVHLAEADLVEDGLVDDSSAEVHEDEDLQEEHDTEDSHSEDSHSDDSHSEDRGDHDSNEDGDGSTSFIEESLANDAFEAAFADSVEDDGQDEGFTPEPDRGVPSTVPSLASLASSEDSSIDPLLSTGDPLAMMGETSDRSGGLFSASGADDVSDDDLNPAEMARQLANLSPKAAKAVAAAAKASTDAERDAALAAVEAEDDSVNRGLLLKFLGSVES